MLVTSAVSQSVGPRPTCIETIASTFDEMKKHYFSQPAVCAVAMNAVLSQYPLSIHLRSNKAVCIIYYLDRGASSIFALQFSSRTDY